MAIGTTSNVPDTNEAEEHSSIAQRLVDAERGFVIEDQGLYVFRDLTPEEWRRVGHELTKRGEAAAWALGDWLVAGHFFRTGLMKEASAITKYTTRHLYKLHHTAKAFPREERRKYPNLRFGHFMVTLSLHRDEDRQRMLELAVLEDWNIMQLQDRIVSLFPVETPPTAVGTERIPRRRGMMKVCCPRCKLVFPIKGNLSS